MSAQRTMTLEEEQAWETSAKEGTLFGELIADTGLCAAAECPRAHYGRGMCRMHYFRWYRAQKRATR